mgnify:CR=1 FL=1
MDTVLTTEEYFPIRVLAERTGVGHSTLRAWERRYGLLKPHRTPKGHRLYTDADTELIKRVLDLLKEGHSISSAAAYLKNSMSSASVLKGPITQIEPEQIPPPGDTPWQGYLEQMMHAIEDFSSERLDAVYNEASSLYPLDVISNQLIVPALDIFGAGWRADDAVIGQEHFFSAWLRNKLGARLHHSSSLATGNTLVVACAPGHRHELGALMFTLAALGRGYRAVYLGADMPLSPLPYIVERSRARALVLAVGEMTDFGGLSGDLLEMKASMKRPLFIGGPIPVSHKQALLEAGIDTLGDQLSLAVHVIAGRIPVHDASS